MHDTTTRQRTRFHVMEKAVFHIMLPMSFFGFRIPLYEAHDTIRDILSIGYVAPHPVAAIGEKIPTERTANHKDHHQKVQATRSRRDAHVASQVKHKYIEIYQEMLQCQRKPVEAGCTYTCHWIQLQTTLCEETSFHAFAAP